MTLWTRWEAPMTEKILAMLAVVAFAAAIEAVVRLWRATR